MSDASRKIVRQDLEDAFEAALPAFREEGAAGLPGGLRAKADQCAEGIRACLRDMTEAPGPDPDLQEALVRLVFGHAEPDLVKALRTYLEAIQHCLCSSRDRIRGRSRGMDA